MRRAVAVCLALGFGIFALVAFAGLTGSWLAAGLGAVAVAALVAWRIARGGLVALDAAACPRAWRVVAALAALAALVQVGRQAVFTLAPDEVSYSLVPSSDWEVRHSCVSAYFVAAEIAGSVPNIYADSHYSAPDDDPSRPRKAQRIGPFRVDVYEYPPPFLLLPRALRLLAPEFDRFRELWFGLCGAVVLIGMLVVARSLGPAAGTRALLLSPLVWAALPTLGTLQKGNVQMAVIAASMVAMILFERQRSVAGGALLAFLTASKLYPGLLGVLLLARRQWRAAAWTTGFGLLFALATLVDLGWAPYAAFLDHAPGLLSGESFPAFRNPRAMAINLSVPGLVFKLQLFGVAGMGFGASKIVGWLYTAVATAAVYFVGRRPLRAGEPPQLPLIWMAILILATLRSPFLPQGYGAFPALWLLTLLAASGAPTGRRLAGALLAWAVLNVFWPLDWPIEPRPLALLNLLPQATTITLAVVALRRRPGSLETRAAPGELASGPGAGASVSR